MRFIPSSDPAPVENQKAWIFLFDSTGMAVVTDTGQLPCIDPAMAGYDLYHFGTLDSIPCCCGSLENQALGKEFSRLNLRKFYHSAGDEFRLAMAFGRIVADLHANFRFCGRCGARTRPAEREHARTCPDCGLHAYPRISPAVIMSVTRGDQILLARGVRFPNKKMFSVLAGFVSPGETLEECVAREVYEETRIRVKNVRYVKSQPWPFPDSLMIGFTAIYESGEIEIEPEEILEAGWFSADRLPMIPDSYTLAGELIRDFLTPREG